MKKLSVQNKIVITIILFILFYSLLAIYSDLNKIEQYYTKINLVFIPSIFGTLFLSWFLRCLLQRYLLQKIGVEISIKKSYTLLLASLSMLVTPGGSGQTIKSYFIQREYGHPVSKTLPLVAVERFFDFIAIVSIIIITMFLFSSLISIVIVIISIAILAGLFLMFKHVLVMKRIGKILEKLPILNKFTVHAADFEDSLQKFLQLKVIVVGSFTAIGAFALEGLVVYMGFLTFDIDMSYLQTFQIYYTSVLYGTLSLIPGGVGILEGTFVNIMLQHKFDLSLIVSLVIFLRLCTVWFATGIGFVFSYFMISKKFQKSSKNP